MLLDPKRAAQLGLKSKDKIMKVALAEVDGEHNDAEPRFKHLEARPAKAQAVRRVMKLTQPAKPVDEFDAGGDAGVQPGERGSVAGSADDSSYSSGTNSAIASGGSSSSPSPRNRAEHSVGGVAAQKRLRDEFECPDRRPSSVPICIRGQPVKYHQRRLAWLVRCL